MSKTGLAVACLVWVSGCASEGNRMALESLRNSCARGDRVACNSIPTQEWVNDQEAKKNAGIAVAATLLLPVLILAAMVDAESSGGGFPTRGGFHHHGGHHSGGHSFGHR